MAHGVEKISCRPDHQRQTFSEAINAVELSAMTTLPVVSINPTCRLSIINSLRTGLREHS